MRKLLCLLCIVFVFACGKRKKITEENKFQPGENLPEIFQLTTDTQDAVFYIKTGYVGCAGTGMPILEKGMEDAKTLHGDIVCFDGSYENEIYKCIRGYGSDPEIKIAARIYMVHQSGTAPIEPELGEKIYWYYEAKVVKLGGIFVKEES